MSKEVKHSQPKQAISKNSKMLPKGWETKHFYEIADIDKNSLGSDTPQDYEFQYVSLSDVDSEEFKIETSKQVFATAPSRARRIVNKGDILMSTVRPNLQGFSFIKNNVKDFIASTGFAVISAKRCSNEFLYHYLFSTGISKQFYQLLVGSNYPAINSADVKKLKVNLPPLSEQKAIASCISIWDEAINKTNQLILKKEQRKKWLTQQLLTGKKRLKGFKGKWNEVELKDVFERVIRRNTEANTNVVTISAQRGFVRQNDFFKKIIASDIIDNYFLVQRGEFCYNKSYSNGYPWGATKRLKDFDKAVVTTLYICFALKDKKKNSGDYFEHFFEANYLDKGLRQIAHEGGRAHGLLNVTSSDFFEITIKIPGFEEQKAIAKLLQEAGKEIELLKLKLQRLQNQKKGLMQILLTGKKRLAI